MPFNYAFQKLGNIQIHTTGCGLCVYDAVKFASTLDKNCNSIVFNTCSFIEEREIENHLLIELLLKAFPEYKFYILGCDIDNNYDKYTSYGCILLKNDEIRKCPSIISNTDSDSISIKIQDGCGYKCTYCIINQLRPKMYSIPYSEIYEALDKKLYKSIELCATEVCNYYDKAINIDIIGLLNRIINDFPHIQHISFSSLDPASPKIEKIIDIINEHKNMFDQHISLAVQSGSDTILKLMRRRHNAQRVIEIHNYAKQHNVSIGWEIITGFPSETETQFNETYELMKLLKPVHNSIFTYSPRKGTEAYSMPNQIDERIKQSRKQILDSLDDVILNLPSDYLKTMMLSSDEVCLNIFDIDELSKFVKIGSNQYTLNITYDENKSLESMIYINFLKEYFKDIPMIINVTKGSINNIPEFESTFKCKVLEKG